MGVYDPDNDCVSSYVAECAECGKEDLKRRMIAVGIKVNRYSNFKTACFFCEQCYYNFLERYGLKN